MRVCGQIDVAAPPELVWRHIADAERAAAFLQGITRWEVVGDQREGVGTRLRMLMRVGSAEIGGLVEVVEWDPGRDFAWVSVLGIDQRGRWRLRARSERRTHVELRLSYGVAGAGLFGWLAERIGGPTVRNHLQRSVRELKRRVEHEQLVEQAAARRRERARVA
ncbi:MAG: SRPBCC family protein [Solirubrobacteraceae bacterium]|nr:MAG: cyclase [Solirubrobacterales bacterium]